MKTIKKQRKNNSYRNASLSRIGHPENPPAVINSRQLGSVGSAGEDAAAAYLSDAGYTVLARNVRYGRRELDIVACDGTHIIFVEVKTRTVPSVLGKSRFGSPSAAVDREKMMNLIDAARCWLSDNPHSGLFPRMDVVEVRLVPAKKAATDSESNTHTEAADRQQFEVVSVNHITNAFGINF